MLLNSHGCLPWSSIVSTDNRQKYWWFPIWSLRKAALIGRARLFIPGSSRRSKHLEFSEFILPIKTHKVCESFMLVTVFLLCQGSFAVLLCSAHTPVNCTAQPPFFLELVDFGQWDSLADLAQNIDVLKLIQLKILPLWTWGQFLSLQNSEVVKPALFGESSLLGETHTVKKKFCIEMKDHTIYSWKIILLILRLKNRMREERSVMWFLVNQPAMQGRRMKPCHCHPEDNGGSGVSELGSKVIFIWGDKQACNALLDGCIAIWLKNKYYTNAMFSNSDTQSVSPD